MKKLILALYLLLATASAQAQTGNVGIGIATPDVSAKLDVSSTNSGFLMPRMAFAQRIAIASPAIGLMVYQTDGTSGLYIYNGTGWSVLAPSPLPLVTTLAGRGTAGSANGTGITANFYYPAGVAVDAYGNVYVADANNNKIRKITPAGVVTTLAGSGSQGSIDATGTAASFYFPYGVAVDASGNVYVADNGNNEIRKITSAGVVTTFAGSGSAGNTDATGTAAEFYSPLGVAVDASGNVYVADYGNNIIRKITSAGVVTTFAGSGAYGSTDATGTAASFNRPYGVAVDASGNVYVADAGNNKIRKITSAGVVTTFAGSGSAGNTDATGTAAEFYSPGCVAVDTYGNVYVGDAGNLTIRKITSSGVVTTLAGGGGPAYSGAGSADGSGSQASFNGPSGVAVDASGNVYVGDASNNKIRKIITR